MHDKNSLSEAELTKYLEEFIKQLQEKKLLPALSKNEVNEIVSSIINDKNFTLTKEDLTNQKEMHILCMAKHQEIKNPNTFKFDYSVLFQTNENTDELKKLFVELFKLTPKYKAASEDEQKEMEEKLEKLFDKLDKKIIRKNDDEEKTNLKSAGIDLIAETLTQLYGTDIRISGGSARVVQGVVAGNAAGFQDLATQGDSVMSEDNKPQFDAFGYSDSKWQSILNVIAANLDSPELEQSLVETGVIPDLNSNIPRLTK